MARSRHSTDTGWKEAWHVFALACDYMMPYNTYALLTDLLKAHSSKTDMKHHCKLCNCREHVLFVWVPCMVPPRAWDMAGVLASGDARHFALEVLPCSVQPRVGLVALLKPSTADQLGALKNRCLLPQF